MCAKQLLKRTEPVKLGLDAGLNFDCFVCGRDMARCRFFFTHSMSFIVFVEAACGAEMERPEWAADRGAWGALLALPAIFAP